MVEICGRSVNNVNHDSTHVGIHVIVVTIVGNKHKNKQRYKGIKNITRHTEKQQEPSGVGGVENNSQHHTTIDTAMMNAGNNQEEK